MSPEAVCASLQHCSSVPVLAAPVSLSASVTETAAQQSDDHVPPEQQHILLYNVSNAHAGMLVHQYQHNHQHLPVRAEG